MTALDLPRAVALTARLAESLKRSRERLATVFPVSGAAVAAFDEAVRTEPDAFLKRFENLTNHLQDQVFRLIVANEALREPSAMSKRDTVATWRSSASIGDSDAFSDALRVREPCVARLSRRAGAAGRPAQRGVVGRGCRTRRCSDRRSLGGAAAQSTRFAMNTRRKPFSRRRSVSA